MIMIIAECTECLFCDQEQAKQFTRISNLLSWQVNEIVTFIIPILQIKTLRLRGVQKLARHDTASKQKSCDSDPSLTDSGKKITDFWSHAHLTGCSCKYKTRCLSYSLLSLKNTLYMWATQHSFCLLYSPQHKCGCQQGTIQGQDN